MAAQITLPAAPTSRPPRFRETTELDHALDRASMDAPNRPGWPRFWRGWQIARVDADGRARFEAGYLLLIEALAELEALA